jgi:hypothetical protein
MHYEIFDEKRNTALPLLKEFKNDFYLAGGTGLALQIGHRDSVDFDFFCETDFDTEKLFEKIKQLFYGHKIIKTQEEKNALTVFVDDAIKISFFAYAYKLIGKIIDEPNLKIASIEDIACMKLSAIVSRATNKDYIDLYFILQKFSLKELLENLNQKLPDLDANLVLKSLVYFKDIIIEPIQFKNNYKVDFDEVSQFLQNQVKSL